ncbi:hypothetical protein SCAR479_06065 [Seiridium cardinale]|uniref:BZIP domain-containing protein n=1 Tax=Seiridium cardinale TaxID=138064 RepID=A0ABR2XU68_9PEZI
MDFSQQYYAGGGQSYQFLGIPPPTPSHSHSAPSEEFNRQSPPDVYDHFQGFEHYPPYNNNHSQAQAFETRQNPPTPPIQHPLNARNQRNPQAEVLPIAKPESLQDAPGGSNSDDEDMTPAQSRRKAQNRAAQRAFRERKERHVKELEAKVAALEAAQQQTSTENDKLKRDLQKMSTENEILRATSSQNDPMSPASNPPTTTGPMRFNPTNFYSDLLANHTNKTPSHRVVESESGERLLAAGATWDFIISHPLFKRGLVDVADVSERLKSKAKCDGQGPVFEQSAIRKAIEESVASGSDELL